MSNSTTLAKRYARALWASLENGGAEELLQNLRDVSALFSENKELNNVALSPAFDLNEKTKIITEVLLKVGTPEKIKDFLTLLLQRERFELLPQIYEEFRLEYLQSNKVKEALIETAYELSDKDQQQIAKVLEAALDSPVQLQVKVNPSLMAGLRVDVDGKTIDATIRANVELLKQELLMAEAN